MYGLNVQFNHPAYRNRDLAESITDVLDHNLMLAMATVQNGEAYINSAHFAYNDRLELLIFTHPYSEHGKNLALNPSVAAAIWKPSENWDMNLQGLQLFGTGTLAEGEALDDAIRIYGRRFPSFQHLIQSAEDFERDITDLRLYRIQVERVKLIDEGRFGHRNWISAPVIHPQPQPERLIKRMPQTLVPMI